ncbi:MAG: YabP/YqfC family sporulation protein, partial [Oscillospiraceae bacterium]|nr:YabP/YqfC family sporulation protein [Oscillospiraceae bacterium]
HIEIESNREVFFENHKGIISLSEEEVEINSPDGCVVVCGSRLKVSAMNSEELRIAGAIDKIEFGRAGER